MKQIELTFRIRLLSDYHSGSGHRAGQLVDSGLLRDFDDTPVLRGSKITGLLRDGLRDLLELPPMQAFKNQINEESEIRLFGAARAQKIWRYSSARPATRGGSKAKRWGALDVTRVRIESRLRRADPQKLFREEEGDRRLDFYFKVSCYNPSEEDQKDALLLIASACMVRHLGSARRRGRGACHIELARAIGLDGITDTLPLQTALGQFKKIWFASKTAVESHDQSSGETTSTSSTSNKAAEIKTITVAKNDKPLRFQCVARLDEPFVIARRAEAGNAYESVSFIPGGAVLGALANRAARYLGLRAFDVEKYQPAPQDFVKLFVRGGVAITGLMPADADLANNALYPSMFVPLDVFVCEKYPQYDRNETLPHPPHILTLAANIPHFCEESEGEKKCDSKLVNPDKPFIPLRPHNRRYVFEPGKREEAHIRMEILDTGHRTGRPEDGALFEYISLEADQYFVGEITFANLACWERFKEMTGIDDQNLHELYLGRASRRGHGKVVIHLQQIKDEEPLSWIREKLEERINHAAIIQFGLRLTLLTDSIIQDHWSRAYLSFEKEWLADLFKLDADDIELAGAFAQSHDIDSFHGHRRLPRWRDRALTAGSSVGIKIKPAGWDKLDKLAEKEENMVMPKKENEPSTIPTNADEHENPQSGNSINVSPRAFEFLIKKIDELEKNGIGLRRNEGFGRIAFNHPLYKQNLEDKRIGMPQQLVPALPGHGLAHEKDFESDWKEVLDEMEMAPQSGWEKINRWYAPISHVIFNSRFLPLARLEKRLEMFLQPTPWFLWGKTLEGREKDSKIKENEKGYQAIRMAIKNLSERIQQQEKDKRWSIGLAMLAERIGLRVKEAKTKEGLE